MAISVSNEIFFTQLLKKAKNGILSGGDMEAQFSLGLIYSDGRGMPRNYKQAVIWYKNAAQQGHLNAAYNLGILFEKGGHGIEANVKESIKWYSMAAEKGDRDAQTRLGLIYLENNSTDLDLKKRNEKAINYFRKAAELGDPEAQFRLGKAYTEGVIEKRDEVQAFEWFRLSAERNHPAAQYYLALAYKNGSGTGLGPDDKQAIKWFRNSADLDYSEAQFKMGLAYYYGKGGLNRDAKVAYKWFQKAASQDHAKAQQYLIRDSVAKTELVLKLAERGDAIAQRMLGIMYAEGRNIEKDLKKALEWLHKSASQDDLKSQLHLAVMYAFGEGVEKNISKAIEWCRKPAEHELVNAQGFLGALLLENIEENETNGIEGMLYIRNAASRGDSFAQFSLGIAYLKGLGVKKDRNHAADWLEKSAATGPMELQSSLGLSFLRGETFPRDVDRAALWFRKAAINGHDEAAYFFGRMVFCTLDITQCGHSHEAISLLAKAANNKHVKAQLLLGLVYFNGGKGSQWEIEEGINWLKKAADNGCPEAYFHLGMIHLKGLAKSFLSHDANQAIQYFHQAANLGHKRSIEELEYLFAHYPILNKVNQNQKAVCLLYALEKKRFHEKNQEQLNEESNIDKSFALKRYKDRLECELNYFIQAYKMASTRLFALEGDITDAIISAISSVPIKIAESVPVAGPILAKLPAIIAEGLCYAHKQAKLNKYDRVSELFLMNSDKRIASLARKMAVARDVMIHSEKIEQYLGTKELQNNSKFSFRRSISEKLNDRSKRSLLPLEKLACIDVAHLLDLVLSSRFKEDKNEHFIILLVNEVTKEFADAKATLKKK